jgi:hypothetical protein
MSKKPWVRDDPGLFSWVLPATETLWLQQMTVTFAVTPATAAGCLLGYCMKWDFALFSAGHVN